MNEPTIQQNSDTTISQSRQEQRNEELKVNELREKERERKQKYRAKLKDEKQSLPKENDIIQIWDNLFDYYKSTFPKSVSKKEWEKLKQDELEFLREEIPDWSVSFFEEMREDNLQRLRENPKHHCAGSMIFFIKTLVHRPRDIRN